MKKVLLALSVSAFTMVFSTSFVTSDAAAWHETKCKKGYYYDDDKKRCVRKRRGSHG